MQSEILECSTGHAIGKTMWFSLGELISSFPATINIWRTINFLGVTTHEKKPVLGPVRRNANTIQIEYA